MKLQIADNLALPLDAVTQTFAILAKRRAGKSYTMRRLVEQLFRAGQQVVLVDPKGDQWGIRSSADGKSAGLPLMILGGEHGDLKTLDPGSGAIIAKMLVEERVSAVLDLSEFRKNEVAHFMGGVGQARSTTEGFLEALYRLKAREEFRTPMMLVCDEADAIAPQKPQSGEERMLGAMEDIVRRGGQRGIGCVVVTQRSAVLNKNVLTQAQVLVVLRTIAPQDLKAMKAWIDVHGDVEQGNQLLSSLPALPIGDAWFWSPGWPTADGIFKHVHVLPIETFDSGASPKPGEKRAEPKTIADVDLDALQRQMSTALQKAKAEDPRELRKQIAELKAQLTKKEVPVTKSEVKRVEVLTEHDRKLLSDLATRLQTLPLALTVGRDEIVDRFQRSIEAAIRAAIDQTSAGVERLRGDFEARLESKGLQKILAKLSVVNPEPRTQSPQQEVRKRIQSAPRSVAPSRAASPRRTPSHTSPENGGLTGPEQRILDAIAWLEVVGVSEPEQPAVAFLAGYTYDGGAFNNPRGRLRQRGFVEYLSGDRIRLTDAGRVLARLPEAPLSSTELHARVLDRLPGPEQRILQPLLEAYPHALDDETLAAAAGYTPGAGAFNNPKGRLRSLGLIDYPQPRHAAARPLLFLE